MGYERNDRRYGRDPQGYGNRYGNDRDNDRSGYGRGDYGQPSYGQSDYGRGDYRSGGQGYGRAPQGYDYEDRGFFDRAGDEVRSWFGDEEAERRREMDERYREREYQRDQARGGSGYGASSSGYAPTSRYGGGSSYGSGASGGSNTYGVGRGAGASSTYGLGAGQNHDDWGRDLNYRSWRDRQIESLDRDYDEYRRENQSKFDQEFTGWRQTRQTQRSSLNQVREHQEVVGSDGQHVGTVDKVRGDRIILTKNDQDAGGHHHSIPCSWIQTVDDKVTISKTAEQAKSHWRDEEQRSALGSDGDRSDGPHYLNRSFSGTY